MAAPSSSSHAQSVNADLLASGRYSDLKIICQEEQFEVHRAIVCSQSKPLAACVDNPLKESLTGEIDLDDCEPAVVEKFLEFLYVGDYFDNRAFIVQNNETQRINDKELEWYNRLSRMEQKKLARQGKALIKLLPSTSSPAEASVTQSYLPKDKNGPLLLNVKLYIMADRYDVQPLKEMAKKKYEQVITTGWNNVSFTESLRVLYDNTVDSDRLLRDVAVKTAGANLKALADRGEFAEMCKANGEIAYDILKSHLDDAHVCPDCGVNSQGIRNYQNCLQCSNCDHAWK